MNMCSEELERLVKRLKMGIVVFEFFMNEVFVNNLGVDFENYIYYIISVKMVVFVVDFGSLFVSEINGFISVYILYQYVVFYFE